MGVTSIEWTASQRPDGTWAPGYTFNPWRGCAKISPGCTNCYAETLSHRNPTVLGVWGDKGTRVVASEAQWRLPLKWDREAKAAGERRRVFCASLADVFEERAELVEPRMRLFQLIARTPHLDWLLLTKRPQTALDNWPLWAGYWAGASEDGDAVERLFGNHIIPNVWLGVSVEDQQRADERIPLLLQTPAAVRFLSCEPLLGPVDLRTVNEHNGTNSDSFDALYGWQTSFQYKAKNRSECSIGGWSRGCPKIDWVIVGGESGPGARPMHPNWARSLRDQCQAAGISYFFKQHGEWAPIVGEKDGMGYTLHAKGSPAGPKVVNAFAFPDGQEMVRLGKKAAGRLLDGRTWDEFPEHEDA